MCALKCRFPSHCDGNSYVNRAGQVLWCMRERRKLCEQHDEGEKEGEEKQKGYKDLLFVQGFC